MTIHFIGAGPGAPDLITVRGLKFISEAPVILYAGSLVPKEILYKASTNAKIINTAPLHLDEIIEEMQNADKSKKDVARLHSGDTSLYGAIAEQIRRLKLLNIDYDITPGVPAYAAAAAALKCELTLPGIVQTVILTRTAVRASEMPPAEDLKTLARTGSTLAIHLSINNLARILRELSPIYGDECPAAIVYRVSWPDEKLIRGTIGNIRTKTKALRLTRTALILVGQALSNDTFNDSMLYNASHTHVLRPKQEE